MLKIHKQQISAVILAGGRSSRMLGEDKGLIKLGNKTLVEHIITTIEHQVGCIFINANRNQDDYQQFSNYPVISDASGDFQGPLAGIVAALKIIKTPYLLILPCDAPLVGAELLAKLANALMQSKAQITVAHDGKRLQPTFALIQASLLNNLLKYLNNGDKKISLWHRQNAAIHVDFSKYQHFFTNINTPEDYAKINQ